MSDALSRRVIHAVEDIERVARDGPTATAAARSESEAALRDLDDSLRRAMDAVAPNRRPASLRRELDQVYMALPGYGGAQLSRGRARPAPKADDVRDEFDALMARAEASAAQAIAVTRPWMQKSGVGRMLGKSSKPPLPSQELCDDLATLVDWVQPVVKADRAALVAQATARASAIRRDGAARIEQVLLRQRAELETLRVDLESVLAPGDRSILPWADGDWSRAAEPGPLPVDLRIGEYEVRAPASSGQWAAPTTISFPFSSGLIVQQDTASRRAAIELARSLCVRLLGAVPAGSLRFTFVDPVSLGQSVADFQHLGDFDPELVDTRPVTGTRDIEAKLANLSAHVETVISKYLRGQFDSIDAYNAVAGEVAEPYRILVVFDYPANFTDESAQRLLSLIENGPRCGLHTIVVADADREQPRDLPLVRLRHGLQRITVNGSRCRIILADPIGAVDHDVLPDVAPPITFKPHGEPLSAFAELLVDVGERSRASGNEAVTLDRLLPVLERMTLARRSEQVPLLLEGHSPVTADPATWWGASSAQGTIAPLGRSGAQDVAALYFSSTDVKGGAIMVGLPRSGKTTSLHAAVLTMCMLYSPDELELFLIDAKHGVEFKIYEKLPHARMVSIHSEREFSVAVLKSLDQEIARRAELMKARTAGRANLSDYRVETGEKMPRIVLIMDEFHEIFEEDDQLGHEAFQAFSNIVRQGPFAGVHVVAASQTLSSMPALDRSTLQLLPERVAFMCNESDADLVMGDENRGTRLLTKQGQGLFNPVRGEASQNKPFQGLFIRPDERDAILAKLGDLARERGLTRVPRIFDGDAAAGRTSPPSTDLSTSRITVAIGEPFALQSEVSFTLRRSRGANVSIVGDVDDESSTDFSARGSLHSCVLAASRAGADVRVVDFIGDEEAGRYATVMELCRATGAAYHRGRESTSVVSALAATVADRLAQEEYGAPTQLLVLFGLQRALSLRPADPYEETPDAAVGNELAAIVRDGPEVGVHVVAAADSAAGLERRLGSELFGEFTLRIAGASASPADLQFVSATFATAADLRRHQLLFGDHQRGSTTRMRAYTPLHGHDLADLGVRR